MSIQTVLIADFLPRRNEYFLLDVRSEGEFAQGHIPGAANIPVLNNEERKIVGTLYKKQGKEAAVLKGFELAGPRFHTMMQDAVKQAAGRPFMIYCWRGGMRSEIFSWLMKFMGVPVFRIKGGYKKYRALTYTAVRNQFSFIVLGGPTGSGKTEILQAMKKQQFQVIDIEDLANHKGSVFGGINMPAQPSVEQFENLLAEELWKLDAQKPIWLENENQLIGKVIIPLEFKNQMNDAALVMVDLPASIREERISKEYSILPAEELVLATKKLEKRLGNLRMNQAVKAIEEGQPDVWIPLLMQYYDQGYTYLLKNLKKEHSFHLQLQSFDMDFILSELKKIENKIAQNGITATHPV